MKEKTKRGCGNRKLQTGVGKIRPQLTPLGELLDFFNGKAPKRADNGEFVVYGSNGPIGRSHSFNHENAIIIGRVGAYCGSVEICRGRFWASDNTIVARSKEGCDLRYMYYRLLSSSLRSYAGGAAQPLLTQTILRNVRVKVFRDISLQVRIASILSAYDDLIENNRRRIQLLEQAARLLYKEWFVHFRFPGHEYVKIKDGLPEGWEKKTISEVCDTIGGGTPSTKNPAFWEGGDITWVTPTDVTRNDCLALIDSENKITEAGLRSSSARLVPPDTILMTSRASVGFFALMEKEVCTNQGFINIVPHQEWLRMYILYNLLWRVEEIRSHAGGTTYKEINKGRFRKLKIVVPTKAVAQEFNDITYQILQQIRTLKKQQLALAKARDLLLPRLMNGEITI
ncbi:restriction endonuclease subunit S [Dissulfuribacter thermophilus]|uniref:restriction endonuclease subunit S n=1 Tax=Dissulfuribacter thermophilus TaxID=1156395 RepID=UPI00137AEE2A|nr:restriction endonuclease subunit S [Dissulfuribacter thermophilus]